MRAATIAAILFIGATAAGASSTYRRGLHTKTFIGRVERIDTQKEEFLCVPSLEFRLEP